MLHVYVVIKICVKTLPFLDPNSVPSLYGVWWMTILFKNSESVTY